MYGPAHVKGIRRFGAISRVLIRHGFGDLLDRLFSRSPDASPDDTAEAGIPPIRSVYPSPVRVRRALEELGPSFIKLGQLMSVRADIFPPDYIEELKILQDRVPPVSFDQIRAAVETGIGATIETSFADFSQKCLAAASVAQVHRARLITGEEVAVKVVRPGIAVKIREDIRVMYYFARRFEQSFELGRIIGAVNLVKEFERTIFRELDMHIEAGNIEKFRSYFSGSDEIYIAEVYWDMVSKSVLVMEFIPGIKMDQVAEIRASGIDPGEVAMIGLRSFSRQLMEFGFFHADPHPGNTLVMYDGRVSLVDFGMTGYLDEETMMQIANLFLGYAEHDYDMIMVALEDAGLVNPETTDMKSFKADLKEMSEPFYGRSLQTISVRDVHDQVMQLIFKHRIRLPRNLLLLFKTFIQTEGLGKILGSDASLLEVTRPYAKKLVQRGYDARKLLRGMGREMRSLGIYARHMPRFIYDIFKRTAEGRHGIEVRHSGFEPVLGKFERGLNRFTVGLIISASTIAGSLIMNSSQKILDIPIAGQMVPLTTLLGVLGYSIATILGLWLIISIFRSGKL